MTKRKILDEYASSQRHSCYLVKGEIEFYGDGFGDNLFILSEKVSKAVAARICHMLDGAYVRGSKDRSQKIREASEIEGEDELDD